MAKATTEPFWPPGSEPNALQRRFIEFADGAALLQAPVGTGKTRSLADRAAAAIRRGVPADRILCLTFTNRAAEQLRERVRDRCGEEGRGIVVRTFHSLCAWILRREHERVGLPADFVVYDEDDTADVMLDIHRRLTGSRAWSREDAFAFAQRVRNAKDRVAAERVDLDGMYRRVAEELPGRVGGVRGSDLAWEYQQQLLAQRAVDFSDLVLSVRALFDTDAEVRTRWRERFRFIQVDEMQDTNLAEYYVVRLLARGAGNVALIGDFDQTIYEWRDSRPQQILTMFRRDFAPVEEFHLTDNYRATRTLIETANAVVRRYSERSPVVPAPGVEEGRPVQFHTAATPDEEARWIGQTIGRLTAPSGGRPLRHGKIAVLVRSNWRAPTISRVFEAMGVPHVTVEQFEFFRRQEVKDALAYMRFLLNPADTYAFRRLLQRPAQGIGDKTMASVEEVHRAGLRLVDMVRPSTFRHGDPHGALLQALDEGTVVVFDTETTGVMHGRDEIIELGALRLERGRPAGEFHHLLRNTVPVGDSEKIHGISDEQLRRQGAEPREVLERFAAFAEGAVLVGHNVMFDLRMLLAAAEKHGVPLHIFDWADTWELARRFIGGEGFGLEQLAERFQFSARPSHRAMDDVRTTVELIHALAPLVRARAAERRAVVAKHQKAFAPVAKRLADFGSLVGRERPGALLTRVLDESGLRRHYEGDHRRSANLRQLEAAFARHDAGELEPRAALEAVVQHAALSRNIDQLDDDVDKVRVVTVHQSKGLEFDAVFVAGLCEYEFPASAAIKNHTFDEEWRVFYVAVTRARKQLYLSGYRENDRGWTSVPSRFLRAVPRP